MQKTKNILSPDTFKHRHISWLLKKQRIEIYAFTVNTLAHNAYKNGLPTQINTASKSCRFISVCKNTQWAIRLIGITANKG